MNAIRRVHHTSITVKSMEQSLEFYRDLLGMEVVGEQGGKGGYLATAIGYPDVDIKVVFLKPTPDSDFLLELIEYRSPVGVPVDARTCNPGACHLCLVAEDVQATYEKLHAAGVPSKSAPVPITAGRHKGGYIIYFTDPDGVTLEMLQLPAGMR